MEPSYSERRQLFRFAALFCAVVAVVLWAGPIIFRVDLFVNDAAQHIFWLYRYADPALFPDDPTARYFGLLASAPIGYRTLYAVIAPHVDVLTAAEWLAAAELCVSFLLAWAIGARLGAPAQRELGGFVAVAMVAWLVGQGSDIATPLALQRSFAMPITLFFLWAVLSERYAWVGVSWLLAALFYPVIIVVLGLAGAAVFVADLIRDRRLPRAWLWNVTAGVGSVAVVLVCSRLPVDIGPAIKGAEALAMPEFGDHGRTRLLFGSFKDDWLRSQLMGLGWSPRVLLGAALAVVVSLAVRAGVRIPRPAWLLLGCGVAVWLIAHLMLFTLYLPNRHTRWSLAAFVIVAAVCAVVSVARIVPRQRAAFDALVVIVAIGAVILALGAPALEHWRRPVDRDLENVYRYVGQTPKASLILAHPDLADFIPVRSQRSVVASTETSLPFMRGYYRSLVPRLNDSLRAAYAADWTTIDAIADRYGATFAVTGPQVWQQQSYYAPFDALVRQLRADAHGQFALEHPPSDRVVYRSGDFYVVSVGKQTHATGQN